MFKDVKSGKIIDNYNNFGNFGSAMLTLFRCSTGEDWGSVMFDLGRLPPDCIPDETCGTCN